jgi:hypothetical protein
MKNRLIRRAALKLMLVMTLVSGSAVTSSCNDDDVRKSICSILGTAVGTCISLALPPLEAIQLLLGIVGAPTPGGVTFAICGQVLSVGPIASVKASDVVAYASGSEFPIASEGSTDEPQFCDRTETCDPEKCCKTLRNALKDCELLKRHPRGKELVEGCKVLIGHNLNLNCADSGSGPQIEGQTP